jgi:hypothetical protein
VSVLVRAYAGRVLEAEHVARLRAEGHRFRAIAAQLGASLGAVQRAWKRHERAEEDDDDERGAVVCGEEYEPTPPFVFCGTETVLRVFGKGDEPRAVESERWLDANGRSCSALDVYRVWAWADG